MNEGRVGIGLAGGCGRIGSLLAAGFLALLAAAPALACPVCDTATGEQVRQGIFDGRFGLNLALTLAPFPVFLLIAALLYHGFPGRRRRASPPPCGR